MELFLSALGIASQIVAFLIILFLLYFFLYSFSIKDPKAESKEKPGVSIVIAAKNEYNNLQKLLPLLFTQDYPDFEIIVVNDGSEDDTYYLVKGMQNEHPNLKVIDVPSKGRTVKGKKLAVTLGIKAAKNDIILLTDADCIPVSDEWIAKMATGFSEGVHIVLGYYQYETKPGLLNKIIRYETLHNALMYLSLAKAGLPYMGVGGNLSYRKKLFFDHNGFAKHMHIMSGDDDLFVNENANAQNTNICIDPKAMVLTGPKTTYSEYINQKIRHLSVGKYYKSKHRLLLSAYHFFNFFFYMMVLTLPFVGVHEFVWYTILLKTLIHWGSIVPIAVRFKTKEVLYLQPLYDFIFTVQLTFIAPYSMVKKLRYW
jgi:poly-beta-1,6-N-acetyl-D-glucosamine synthase